MLTNPKGLGKRGATASFAPVVPPSLLVVLPRPAVSTVSDYNCTELHLSGSQGMVLPNKAAISDAKGDVEDHPMLLWFNELYFFS